MKKKVVFLDRDGVINIPLIKNKKTYAPRKFSKFRFYPYTKKNCEILIKLGYKLIIITNQPDISIKKLKVQELNKMHNKIIKELNIKNIFVSRSSNDNNPNRKPNPGLLIKAIKKHDINVKKSFMIGDRRKDIEAAYKIKCKSIFIDRNYNEKKPVSHIFSCSSLSQAVKFIKKYK